MSIHFLLCNCLKKQICSIQREKLGWSLSTHHQLLTGYNKVQTAVFNQNPGANCCRI